MSVIRKITVLLVVAALLLSSACGKSTVKPSPAAAEKNGSVVILLTGDVHCGINSGFGYAGVQQIRDNYEKQGYSTLLVDCGDAIQGETIGALTKGEDIIDLMNGMKYDVATPGNHEFDYGADYFASLSEKAEFPYVSCNLTKNGETVFEPYVIKEVEGIKIAFVGITTPDTITSSTPAFFQDENGEFIWNFKQGNEYKDLYAAVQSAVDAARSEGADYVYALGHIGLESTLTLTCSDIIENTNGIDVFLDGHSHDTEQVTVQNSDGEDVTRIAAGTKLNSLGCSIISPENGVEKTETVTWYNSVSAADLFGIENDISKLVGEKIDALNEQLSEVIAKTDYNLTVYDPALVDEDGNPVRMVRRAETNMGDFCADAILKQTGADIALINGGGVRADIQKGDITRNDVLNVFPFNNQICVIEASGQQILDALEWGAQSTPEEFGGFLQVAGMAYEIDLSVPSGCTRDENNMQAGINGARRVKNVTIGGEPIDPGKVYEVAGINYNLINNGDGCTAFDGATVVRDNIMLDSKMLMDYFTDTLGGEVPEEYANPQGQGRITVTGQ